jgi:SAM-dependent methyltransferase
MAQDLALQTRFDREKINEVREYFNQWSIYQKAMCNNYLHHVEVYGMLHDLMANSFGRPFSVLDLGCGDALFIAEALCSTRVERYTGVDISSVALDLARKNLKGTNYQKSLVNGDILAFVDDLGENHDLIWIGLSMHHLARNQKERLISRCGQILRSGGLLMVYDPVLREGEDISHHTQRWWEMCRNQWNALTPEEKDAMHNHVSSSDFPESMSALKEMGLSCGFRGIRSLFCDPCKIYHLILFQK